VLVIRTCFTQLLHIIREKSIIWNIRSDQASFNVTIAWSGLYIWLFSSCSDHCTCKCHN